VSVTDTLLTLERILSAGGFAYERNRIKALRILGESSIEEERVRFRSQITGNKYFWGGMGTAADLIMPTPELNKLFFLAYYDLAVACEREGLSSIYSRDIKHLFGRRLGRETAADPLPEG